MVRFCVQPTKLALKPLRLRIKASQSYVRYANELLKFLVVVFVSTKYGHYILAGTAFQSVNTAAQNVL